MCTLIKHILGNKVDHNNGYMIYKTSDKNKTCYRVWEEVPNWKIWNDGIESDTTHVAYYLGSFSTLREARDRCGIVHKSR